MFNWLKDEKNTENPTLGINLPPDNRVAAVELKNIADKFKNKSEQINKHLKKATKDRELANKLASSFVHNYQVMIDISVLLNQYADFFQSIKEVLSRSDVQLEQLNAQNFQNLELLTRQEMDKFTGKFNDQATKIKKLFETYNMNEQAAKLGAIPQLTGEVAYAAENVKNFSGGKKHLRKELVKLINGHQKKGTQAKTRS
jgi:monoamine oxidase